MTDAVPALKNADGMLQEIIKAVDTDGDGKIQYEGWHFPACSRSHSLAELCCAVL